MWGPVVERNSSGRQVGIGVQFTWCRCNQNGICHAMLLCMCSAAVCRQSCTHKCTAVTCCVSALLLQIERAVQACGVTAVSCMAAHDYKSTLADAAPQLHKVQLSFRASVCCSFFCWQRICSCAHSAQFPWFSTRYYNFT
jgi:hypothetical protein